MLRPGLLGSYNHYGDSYCLPPGMTREEAAPIVRGGFRGDPYRWALCHLCFDRSKIPNSVDMI
jgi:hypothetical protein